MIFWLVLKLEINCRVFVSLKDFGFFLDDFWKIMFLYGEIGI